MFPVESPAFKNLLKLYNQDYIFQYTVKRWFAVNLHILFDLNHVGKYK